MKEAPPQSTENRRLHFGKRRWWLLALLLAACAYPAWREYDYRSAVSEARAAGFTWTYKDTISLIRQDWRNALKKETWSTYERELILKSVPHLARYRDLIHRLSPTAFEAIDCKVENLDSLEGLTSLRSLNLFNCPALQNVDAIKSLANLQRLNFLYGIPSANGVYTELSTNIPAAALHELDAALPNTYIVFPDGTERPQK